MARITPVLWKQKKNKQGLSPIYLRIEANDKRRYVSLRTFIRESQWNPKNHRVRKGHPNADAINNLIGQRIAQAEAEILKRNTERQPVTAATLQEALRPKNGISAGEDFIAYADSVVEDHRRRGQLHTYKRYKSVFRKLRQFTGEPFPFERVTPRFLREYETHLIEHHGNNTNTVASNFNAIRAVLYRAIREGYVDQGENPFFQFRIREGKTSRAKLTLQEVRRIEALDLPAGSLVWHVRNYFLFSFYCAGVRFGDLSRLTWKQLVGTGGDVRLVYQMGKTGAGKSIKLLLPARAILSHYEYRREDSDAEYIFPILDDYDLTTPAAQLNAISAQNALVNKYLKKIAEQAGLQCKLSFHVSRHSFADVARANGMSTYNISKALGHSSLKVTENYLRGFDADALDAEMEDLFG